MGGKTVLCVLFTAFLNYFVVNDIIATNHFFKIRGSSKSKHTWFIKNVIQVVCI